MAGTWTTITNAPPDEVATTLLLTDGRVLAQGYGTNAWYRYSPRPCRVTTSTARGPRSPAAPRRRCTTRSGILRDGRVIYSGGEYDGFTMVFLSTSEIYDPIANTWTLIPAPAGWTAIGDSPGCVLPDGRWFVGRINTTQTAIYDPATSTWTAAANKLNNVSEEGWSLLPDGTILSIDATNPPNAEKYVIAAEHVGRRRRHAAVARRRHPRDRRPGAAPRRSGVRHRRHRLHRPLHAAADRQPARHMGGRARRSPRSTTRRRARSTRRRACCRTAGCCSAPVRSPSPPASTRRPRSSSTTPPPTRSRIVPGASTAATVPYQGRMLMLPTGQVLYTTCSATVDVYTPDGAPDPVWTPTITGCPSSVDPGIHVHAARPPDQRALAVRLLRQRCHPGDELPDRPARIERHVRHLLLPHVGVLDDGSADRHGGPQLRLHGAVVGPARELLPAADRQRHRDGDVPQRRR